MLCEEISQWPTSHESLRKWGEFGTRGVNKGCSALPRVGGAPSGVEMLDTGGPRVKTKRLWNTWG